MEVAQIGLDFSGQINGKRKVPRYKDIKKHESLAEEVLSLSEIFFSAAPSYHQSMIQRNASVRMEQEKRNKEEKERKEREEKEKEKK